MDPLLPGLVSAPDKYLWSVEAEPGEMLLRQTIRRMMPERRGWKTEMMDVSPTDDPPDDAAERADFTGP